MTRPPSPRQVPTAHRSSAAQWRIYLGVLKPPQPCLRRRRRRRRRRERGLTPRQTAPRPPAAGPMRDPHQALARPRARVVVAAVGRRGSKQAAPVWSGAAPTPPPAPPPLLRPAQARQARQAQQARQVWRLGCRPYRPSCCGQPPPGSLKSSESSGWQLGQPESPSSGRHSTRAERGVRRCGAAGWPGPRGPCVSTFLR